MRGVRDLAGHERVSRGCCGREPVRKPAYLVRQKLENTMLLLKIPFFSVERCGGLKKNADSLLDMLKNCENKRFSKKFKVI